MNFETPIPSKEEISDAVRVLSGQWLHIYQLLYKHGYTTPEGFPIKVTRKIVGSNSITPFLTITLYGNPDLYFNTTGWNYSSNTNCDNEILEKCKLLIDGAKLKKTDKEHCCAYAVPRYCVCRKSFKCVLHGETCIGTHD